MSRLTPENKAFLVSLTLQGVNDEYHSLLSRILHSLRLGLWSNSSDLSEEDALLSPVNITDDWGLLSVAIPDTWIDVHHSLWLVDGKPLGLQTWAAPNIEAYQNEWRTPGLRYGVWLRPELSLREVLDDFDFGEICTSHERLPYADAEFIGAYDFGYDCSGTDTFSMVLVSTPKEDSETFLILEFRSSLAHKETLFKVLAQSFSINRKVDIETLMTGLVRETQEQAERVASVVTYALNVRSGPGIGYSLVSTVRQGERLYIQAANADCSWLNIRTPDNRQGWVSGNNLNVRFDVACSQIPK